MRPSSSSSSLSLRWIILFEINEPPSVLCAIKNVSSFFLLRIFVVDGDGKESRLAEARTFYENTDSYVARVQNITL